MPKQYDSPAGNEDPTFRLDTEIAQKYDPQDLSRFILRDAGRGEPLDLHTRSRMEKRLGGDFKNVRIIRGPLAEEVTARYRADAVTVGGTELILVREGWQSNFQTVQGGALLAHELTHVQQQQRGLHFQKSHGDGSSELLEREAEGAAGQFVAQETGSVGQSFDDQKLWAKVFNRALKAFAAEQAAENDRRG